MEAKCSFSSLAGGPCSYDPRDRSKSTEVIPFINCKRDITGHKSSLAVTDVESETELILSRASIFSSTEANLSELTICPRHRSTLGIGWRRGSNKCQVPPPIPKHDEEVQKLAKAERGLGKNACHIIWQTTGKFIQVGSGVCRYCRLVLSEMHKQSVFPTEKESNDEEEISATEEPSFTTTDITKDQKKSMLPLAASTPLCSSYDLTQPETPGGSLYLPPTILEETDASATGIEVESVPRPIEHLNTFLKSRDISPIRYTLRTPWEEASGRTKRQHERKARQAITAVLGEIAPNDSDCLWEAVVSSQEKKAGVHKSDGMDEVHVTESSTTPDHCIVYALSDPKDTDYQSICPHDHSDCCGQCNRLAVTMEEIEKAIEKTVLGSDDASQDVNDELTFLTRRAKRDVNAWKSHLLRSVNQDKARLDALQVLDETSALLVQDWAMKFIPRKYRESQKDWFAKRGIPWHVSVAMRKGSDGNF
ncbi:hypothetical protein ACROYT_G044785 [Oculina patagonica]